MKITTRAFQKSDLPRCLAIEEATAPQNCYFKDVMDYFTTTRGELTLGLVDGQVAGFGKLTVLFDGSAWLELLRVDPAFQRQGVGNAIYQRYLEQIAQLGCPAAGMYTGVRNVASAALAEKNGLSRGGTFRGMSLLLKDVPKREGAALSQVPDAAAAAALLEPLEKSCGGKLCINHTFYGMNSATYGGFAANGWIYEGQGSVLVLGARFQPAKALYIAALGGEREQGLSYAIAQAQSRGIPKLTAHFPASDREMEDFYTSHGFLPDPSDDVVIEGSF